MARIYEVKWYVNVRLKNTYMGSDIFSGTLTEAYEWADEHCDGFQYEIVEI